MPAHCSLNPDRAVYFVLCRFSSGLSWVERDVARTDKRSTIEDIRTGELSNVEQVIELHVAEFSSRDVTEDLLQEVKNEAAIRWEPESIDHQAILFDQRHDQRKNWVPA